MMMTRCNVMVLALLAVAGCAPTSAEKVEGCQTDSDCLNGYFCNPEGVCEEEKQECISHSSVVCQEDALFWVDSCENLEEEKETCPYGCNPDNTRCANCVPDCGESCCGDDGCGGSCEIALCNESEECDPASCQCKAANPCAAGLTLCGYKCADLNTDSHHCGACDAACGAEASCQAGACVCNLDFLMCEGECIDPLLDPFNCGDCGVECDPGPCVQGECDSGVDCEELGLTDCNSECVDLNANTDHCGNCDVACRPDQVCSEGQCDCPETEVVCSGECVDLDSDHDHCGDCSVGCRPDQVCQAGLCVCYADWAECSGVCVDLDSDPNNCGVCGEECQPGDSCINGMCKEVCCEGRPLHGFIAGQMLSLPAGDPAEVSLGMVAAIDAMMNPSPPTIVTSSSNAQGLYKTDCIDLSQVMIGLALLSDDPLFDGPAGHWYPTYTPILAINSDADCTCEPDAPDAWAVPTQLVAALAQQPELAGIESGGFAVVFVQDPHGNPVEGAEVLQDSYPPDIPGITYPNMDFTDFSGTSTSPNGIAVIPSQGPMLFVLAV